MTETLNTTPATFQDTDFVLVPRAPTDEMCWAGGTALHDEQEDSAGVYRAMIAAAPQIAGRFVDLGHIPMPQNADEAKAMWLLGEHWVRANAPELIKAPAFAAVNPSGGWSEHNPPEIVRRTRCMADETRDPTVWRDCCDLILERLGHLTTPEATPSPPPLSPRKGQEESPCPMTVEEVSDAAIEAGCMAAWEVSRPFIAREFCGGNDPGTWSDQEESLRAISRQEVRAAYQAIRASEEDR